MPANRRILVIIFVLFTLLLTAGCDPAQPTPAQPPGGSTPADKQTTPPTAETMRLTVYHATRDAMYLVPEVHSVPKTAHPAQSAIELLLSEPKSAELVRTLPDGTKLKGVTIKEHVAYVDFNDKLIKNGRGGSAGEILAVGAIVNTLTEFPEIHKVQILVEGKKVETLYGHMDTSEPLSRSEKIIKKSL